MTKLDFIKDNVDNIFKCQQEIRDIFQDSYTDFNKINSAEQRIGELNNIINISCQSIEDALNAEYYHHLPRKFIIFKKYFKVFMMSSIILIECPRDPNNLDWDFCIAQIKEYLNSFNSKNMMIFIILCLRHMVVHIIFVLKISQKVFTKVN